NVFAKDAVTRDAMGMLSTLATTFNLKARGTEGNGVVTEARLAGLAVPNYMRQGQEFVDLGGYITLGQYVLREAIRKVAHLPEYEEKVSLYNSMDAGEAYVELFDSTPLVAILGEAANNFGPQLTVG